MLAHSKNVFQAEIDAVCELADFFRFNAFYMQQIYQIQPNSTDLIWDRLDHRPLEGFVFAVTPFNFVSINGNLPSAPAMLGNVSVWKPASTAAYTSHFLMKIFREAGLPGGVINMIFARGAAIGDTVLRNKHLAGIHFTGSTGVFQMMWKTVGENIANYRCYPRIVGETGGKDFIFAHNSADIGRGRHGHHPRRVRVPGPEMFRGLALLPAQIKMAGNQENSRQTGRRVENGRPRGLHQFHQRRHRRIGVSDHHGLYRLRQSRLIPKTPRFLCGGKYDESKGWFIEPTVVVTDRPAFQAYRGRDFRPGGDAVRLRRRQVRRDAAPVRPDLAVRPDRGDLRHRPQGGDAGRADPAQRGR